MILPLLYFRDKLDPNSQDHINSTALHWAAYTNSEGVIAYLLAEDSFTSLDNQDNEGNTALMLAVTYGNTRVVRRLLIKGGDRYIPSHNGKTPMEVAVESKFHTISKMLNQQYTYLDLIKFYCNVKL
jgi:palmitoyltransferase